MASIHIYTDGSALGNPGPGGYGIIIEWVGKNYIKEFNINYKQVLKLKTMEKTKKTFDIFMDRLHFCKSSME